MYLETLKLRDPYEENYFQVLFQAEAKTEASVGGLHLRQEEAPS